MVTRIATFPAKAQDVLTVAFYYDVKSKPLPKPGFVPAISNLDQATIDAVRAGTIIEVVRDLSFSGWKTAEIQATLQKEWAVGQEKALADSVADAEGVGMFFDGNAWA